LANITNNYLSKVVVIEEIPTPRIIKIHVLNYLFRNFCFVDVRDKLITIPQTFMQKISLDIRIPLGKIEIVIKKFLVELFYFRKFLNCIKLSWDHDLKTLNRKLRIYLHKCYRMAPIFNYNRARTNLRILYRLLESKFHWPQITTQIALTVFVTDRNDTNIIGKKYILQKNLRVLCNCSAYAFHRARNKLGINKLGIVCNQ